MQSRTTPSKPISIIPVAIIGAGLSGLATATRLLSYNIPATVFEAQARVGGRVHTVQTRSGVNLDLGATWFHGTVGNAALQVAIASGALAAVPPPLPEHLSTEGSLEQEYGLLMFSTEGIHVTPDGEVRKLQPAVSERIVRQYGQQSLSMDKVSNCEASPDVSVLEVMRRVTGYAEMNQLERAIFRSRDLIECAVNGCNGSTAALSAKRVNDYEILSGDNLEPGEHGMEIVVNGLMKNLKEDQVLLNSEVTSIKWDDSTASAGLPPVEIGFKDGKVVYAECVVWTCSLNATKKAIENGLFNPGLPKRKKDAFNGREQGVIDKVFAVLDHKLEGVVANCSIPVVWELESEDITTEDEGTRIHWEKDVFGLTYNDAAMVVSFWLSGDAALHFEQLESTVKVSEVSKLLSTLFQHDVGVEEVLNSSWGTNEFLLGSYSFPRVGSERDCVTTIQETLQADEHGVLLFAGEASHERFYSTMHGAIESGYREAEKAARLLDKT